MLPVWAGLGCTGGAAAEASTSRKPDQHYHWRTGLIHTAERARSPESLNTHCTETDRGIRHKLDSIIFSIFISSIYFSKSKEKKELTVRVYGEIGIHPSPGSYRLKNNTWREANAERDVNLGFCLHTRYKIKKHQMNWKVLSENNLS